MTRPAMPSTASARNASPPSTTAVTTIADVRRAGHRTTTTYPPTSTAGHATKPNGDTIRLSTLFLPGTWTRTDLRTCLRKGAHQARTRHREIVRGDIRAYFRSCPGHRDAPLR